MSATTQEEQKRAVGRAAVSYVKDGMVLGVGTGTTAAHFIAGLIEARPAVKAFVASSERSAAALRAAGLDVTDLDAAGPVDLYIDGADEIDAQFRMIKGGGGAHTREKIVAAASSLFVCIVDESKLVDRLGAFPLPLAVVPMAKGLVTRSVTALGGAVTERAGFLTDDGDLVLDVAGLDFGDPDALELQLDALPGVVECGVFARRPADVLLRGTPAGVEVTSRASI
jgi:ribose 5-phosphate isomerase A